MFLSLVHLDRIIFTEELNIPALTWKKGGLPARRRAFRCERIRA
jgi:hypothetical protein